MPLNCCTVACTTSPGMSSARSAWALAASCASSWAMAASALLIAAAAAAAAGFTPDIGRSYAMKSMR